MQPKKNQQLTIQAKAVFSIQQEKEGGYLSVKKLTARHDPFLSPVLW